MGVAQHRLDKSGGRNDLREQQARDRVGEKPVERGIWEVLRSPIEQGSLYWEYVEIFQESRHIGPTCRSPGHEIGWKEPVDGIDMKREYVDILVFRRHVWAIRRHRRQVGVMSK